MIGKIKFLVLMVFSCVIVVVSMDNHSVPNSFTDGDVIYADEIEGNDSANNANINNLQDTIEHKYFRITDFEAGDSSLTRLNVDTAQLGYIRGNPDIDSAVLGVIRGNPNIDSVDISYSTIDTIDGYVYIDSVRVNYLFGNYETDTANINYAIIDTAMVEVLRGNTDIDSIQNGLYWDVDQILIDTLKLKLNKSPEVAADFRVYTDTAGAGPSFPTVKFDIGGGIYMVLNGYLGSVVFPFDVSVGDQFYTKKITVSEGTEIDSVFVNGSEDSLIIHTVSPAKYWAIPER